MQDKARQDKTSEVQTRNGKANQDKTCPFTLCEMCVSLCEEEDIQTETRGMTRDKAKIRLRQDKNIRER